MNYEQVLENTRAFSEDVCAKIIKFVRENPGKVKTNNTMREILEMMGEPEMITRRRYELCKLYSELTYDEYKKIIEETDQIEWEIGVRIFRELGV